MDVAETFSAEKLSAAGKNPKVLIGLGLLVIAGIVGWMSMSGGESAANAGPAQSFYTVDDGKTWFKESADLIPPFQHEGKPAVQVYLFSSDGGKTQFPGYLQRYDATTKQQLESNKNTPRTIAGVEVKKPGRPTAWTPRNSKAGMDIVNVKPPAVQVDP